MYCKKAKSNIFWEHVLRLMDYFLTELNSKILVNVLLNWHYIMNKSKLETKLFHAHNGLKQVSTILNFVVGNTGKLISIKNK